MKILIIYGTIHLGDGGNPNMPQEILGGVQVRIGIEELGGHSVPELMARGGDAGLSCFWEHVRDALDYERHMDYNLYYPIKHGYVMSFGLA